MPREQSSPAKSFTVRLTDTQREKLEQLSAGRPLAEYIRARALSEELPTIQRRGLHPIKDQQAAHQLLRVGPLAHLRAAVISCRIRQAGPFGAYAGFLYRFAGGLCRYCVHAAHADEGTGVQERYG